MAEVLHLFICLVHRFPMQEVESAEAIADKGFHGCIHGRRGSERQVLLMDSETLERFDIPPGALKENVTTVGIDFQTLKIGQSLRVGESLLEITVPCDPCPRMDEIRMGLQQELRGQRGWLCKVIEAGVIRKGDRIEVETRSRRQLAIQHTD
ncbi:MAG: MOSC domain-containing protein [Candidatus Acidiferrales bacterium]|jgi:MOSC domain-containing protein YiiM